MANAAAGGEEDDDDDYDGDAKFQAEVSVTRIMVDSDEGKGMGRTGDDIPSSFRSFHKSAEHVVAAGDTEPDGNRDQDEEASEDSACGPFVVGQGFDKLLPAFVSCDAPVGQDVTPLRLPAGDAVADSADADGSDPY